MPCYHPITAYQPLAGGKLIFSEKPNHREITIACTRCIGCRTAHSEEWALRITAETQMHEPGTSWFVTPTYTDEFNPLTLVPRHHTLLMKKLRKHYGPVRFYMCGEYGEQSASADSFGRPHFHYGLFGLNITDLEVWNSHSANPLWTSATMDKIWGMGRVIIGQITKQSAQYMAGYIHKKRLGKDAPDYYCRVHPDTGEILHYEPEFSRMSRRPGLGEKWFKTYHSDVYPHDGIILPGGRRVSPPAFYDTQYQKLLAEGEINADPDSFEQIKNARIERAAKSAHNTKERLKARETVATARSNFFANKTL